MSLKTKFLPELGIKQRTLGPKPITLSTRLSLRPTIQAIGNLFEKFKLCLLHIIGDQCDYDLFQSHALNQRRNMLFCGSCTHTLGDI